MSHKRASVSSKISTHSSTNTRAPRTSKPSKPPRRVVSSKKLPSNSSYDGKSCSTGGISENKNTEKPKKVTKSDFTIKKHSKNSSTDYCKNCGDSSCNGDAKSSQNNKDSDIETLVSMPKYRNVKTNNKLNGKTNGKIPKVQQYYKNENFKLSTESFGENNGVRKGSLDTIKEVSEIRSRPSSLFKIYDESEDEFENLDSKDSLDEIKEFRQKNYFECHSANSRIKNRGSATSLQDHKCVYRFYLNDRLFPVPLCTDHTNEIRCIECLLPMNLQVGSKDKINGTIQAKVTLGKKNQDVMILLPIKEPLIIHEKRKETKTDNETVYFGLINLDKAGRSVFNPDLPANSLALKYQKGFQEFESTECYSYNDLEKNDVIVV